MFQYRICAGTMSENGKTLEGPCYSGQPQAKNDPSRVREHDVGPCPPGKYRIGKSYTDPKKGPWVMALTPLPGTDTFGRSGLLIHGDSVLHPGTASEGCIICPHDMRVHIAAARDRVLEVVA